MTQTDPTHAQTNLIQAQAELTSCLNPDGTVELSRLSERSRTALREANLLHSPRQPTHQQMEDFDLKEWVVTDEEGTEFVFGMINLPQPYRHLSRLELVDDDFHIQLPPIHGELTDELVDQFFAVRAQTRVTPEQISRAEAQMEWERDRWERDMDEIIAGRFTPALIARCYPQASGDLIAGRTLESLSRHQRIELSGHQHPVTWLKLPSGEVAVDEEMAPAIRRLNADGIQTLYCCQGDPENGGAYVAVAGQMPRVLEDLCLILGLKFQQERGRWMIWDTAIAPMRAQHREMFMRLMRDISEVGLGGLDPSGQRYMVPPSPPRDALSAYRRVREKSQARLTALSAASAERD